MHLYRSNQKEREVRRRTTTGPQQSGTGATFRDGDLNTAHVTAAVEAKYPGTKSRRTAGARTTMASECNVDVRENRRDGGRGAVAEHYLGISLSDLGISHGAREKIRLLHSLRFRFHC